jgi:hypothetical protein
MNKTDPNRYKVVKQTWGRPCEHDKCDTLHRNRARYNWVCTSFPIDGRSHRYWWHEVTATEWIIVDKVTDERAFDGDAYETKGEAQYWLQVNLTHLQNQGWQVAAV